MHDNLCITIPNLQISLRTPMSDETHHISNGVIRKLHVCLKIYHACSGANIFTPIHVWVYNNNSCVCVYCGGDGIITVPV